MGIVKEITFQKLEWFNPFPTEWIDKPQQKSNDPVLREKNGPAMVGMEWIHADGIEGSNSGQNRMTRSR